MILLKTSDKITWVLIIRQEYLQKKQVNMKQKELNLISLYMLPMLKLL